MNLLEKNSMRAAPAAPAVTWLAFAGDKSLRDEQLWPRTLRLEILIAGTLASWLLVLGALT